MHICAYNRYVTFEWDPNKAANNRRKHRVDFADAVGVFEDPRALTRDDPHPDELRHITMGLDFLGRVVVVCWTGRRTEIRIISARKAMPAERRQYESEG
jgi:uncharacterized DUF497 family protein